MPRAFLVKKKQAACGGWRWRDPEQLEWREDPSEGEAFLLTFFVVFPKLVLFPNFF